MRRGPSITALLIGIATLPAFVMFLVVSASIYATRVGEVRADLDERGRLLAAVLADGSRYGIVSGNVPALQETLRGLMTTDASIAGIEILDVQRRPIASAGTAANGGALVFERPIKGLAIDADLFDSSAPHGIGDERPKFREGPLIGYSRVRMSPEPLMKARRTGLLIAGLIVL